MVSYCDKGLFSIWIKSKCKQFPSSNLYPLLKLGPECKAEVTRCHCKIFDWTRFQMSATENDKANLEVQKKSSAKTKSAYILDCVITQPERKLRTSHVPYLANIRNLNSGACCVFCAISQATEDGPPREQCTSTGD